MYDKKDKCWKRKNEMNDSIACLKLFVTIVRLVLLLKREGGLVEKNR